MDFLHLCAKVVWLATVSYAIQDAIHPLGLSQYYQANHPVPGEAFDMHAASCAPSIAHPVQARPTLLSDVGSRCPQNWALN